MKKNRLGWLAALACLYIGVCGQGSCGKQAEEAIQDAKVAVEEARLAEGPQYAPDEFRSAEDNLALAREQYDDYRFRSAESAARKAEADAKLALELAMESRAEIRAEEERERKEAEEAALAYNKSTLYGDTTLDEPTAEEMAKTALNDVRFPFDSSELSEEAKSMLALNAQWLVEHPKVKVELEGHCDERGTEEYNLALGAKRAKTVYDFLLAYGVDPARMRTISYGESLPLDPASNEEAWAKNRRVHFAVIQ